MQYNTWKSIVEFRLSVENHIAHFLKSNMKKQLIILEEGNNRGTGACSAVLLLSATTPLMLCPLVEAALKLKPLESLDTRSYAEEHAIIKIK